MTDLTARRQQRCVDQHGDHDWQRAAGVPVGDYTCARCGARSLPVTKPASRLSAPKSHMAPPLSDDNAQQR